MMEIIVADDGSSDNTVKNVKKFIAMHKDFDIRILRCGHYGKSKTVNIAIRQSKYPIVMSVDADVELARDTIQKLILPLQNKRVAATNAVAAIRNPHGLLEHFQMIEFSLNNLIRSTFSNVFDNSIWFYGVVAAYRKDTLEKVGMFKQDTLTEDMDLCLGLYRKDYKIVTVSDAIITTKACSSIRSFFRQRMRWYFGALQSLYKNKTLLSKKRQSASVNFLFFNQLWWTVFAFIFFPMTAYQIYYWFPLGQGLMEPILYIVRWFSVFGPFYVLYKFPQWGLNFLNIFGVMAGVITFIMILLSLKIFWVQDEPYTIKKIVYTIIGIIFYFPFTIIIDLTIIFGILKYSFSPEHYFIN